MAETKKELTAKQAAFIEGYLATFNATEAARRAKYDGSDNTLAAVGYENLRKPQIAEAISRRLAETAMDKDEVLMRLAEHARGDMGDFITILPDGETMLDLTGGANTRLIKKVTQRRSVRTTKDSQTEEVVLSVELHDSQAALVHIGKHHGLFTEQLDHSGEIVITVKYGDKGTSSPPAKPAPEAA